jgi:hypothetical protein
MKKILNIILFITLGLFITSCERDTGVDVPERQLKVTQAEVIFETQGGEGFIIVSAPGAVTAKSNEEWCTVNVSGTTINLVAEPNTGVGGRTATITIQSGSETIEVTAVQTAAVMWFRDFTEASLSFLSEGSTIETQVVTSYPVTVKAKPDWITYKFENGSLYLTATASSPRKGSITFESEGRTITYNIVQVSYTGFLGEWEMKFNNPSNSNLEEKTTVTFDQKTANASFLLNGLVITGTTNAEILVNFNPLSNNVTISAGQYLMTASDGRFVYLSLRSAAGTYQYGTSAQLAGILDIADDGTVTYTFVENGTWAGAAGIGFYLFTGEPPSSSTATGSSYRRFMDIVMTKK